ncbi:MAG: N-acetylneuraminate synthase family protein [Phycisphaerales bacterium]|nr:N-acetylneuraminate synthase family protein [Phycisphaerales bacterium]
MNIGATAIGLDAPPYIIAELGVNHDGDVQRAHQLIDLAADAGADAIKLQHFRADLLMSAASRPAVYQRAAGFDDPHAMLRALELSLDALTSLAAHARERNVDPIVTVFSVELVGDIDHLPWAAYKVASPDCVHAPLIQRLMRTGRPLFISTGATTMQEVRTTLSWIEHHPAALLHCVSAYPTPDDDAALGGIVAMSRCTDRPVGYSDHTMSIDTGGLAVAAGAVILERHLTYDTNAVGPDHAASLAPADFATYINAAHRAQRMRGPWTKTVRTIEEDVRSVSRQSVVAARALPAGHVIEPRDVTCKRPGEGLPAALLDSIIGRALQQPIDADAPLTEAHLQ